MMHQSSSVSIVVAAASLLLGTMVGRACAEELTMDLGQALQKFADDAARRNESKRTLPAQPGLPAGVSSAHGSGFVLSGVVIAGEKSMALLQQTADVGGVERVRIGAPVGGYRLTDVQADHVTLEGRGGERVTVRLSAGGGAGPVSSSALSSVPQPTPTPAPAATESGPPAPLSQQEKVDRRAQRDETFRQERARELAERLQGRPPQPAPTPQN